MRTAITESRERISALVIETRTGWREPDAHQGTCRSGGRRSTPSMCCKRCSRRKHKCGIPVTVAGALSVPPGDVLRSPGDGVADRTARRWPKPAARRGRRRPDLAGGGCPDGRALTGDVRSEGVDIPPFHRTGSPTLRFSQGARRAPRRPRSFWYLSPNGWISLNHDVSMRLAVCLDSCAPVVRRDRGVIKAAGLDIAKGWIKDLS